MKGSKKIEKTSGYFVTNDSYIAFSETSVKVPVLPSGIFQGDYNQMTGQVIFTKVDLKMDEILSLPDSNMLMLTDRINKFWSTDMSAKYKEYGLIQKLGILLYGKPGCHAKDTEILMYDGSIKKVQDVVIGDLLMGPDSQPRKVLDLARDKEQMVRIIPTKGESFIVNKSHILHLTSSGDTTVHGPLNITVDNFVKSSQVIKNRYKLTRTGVEFNNNDELLIPPYILGLWLGDGTSRLPTLTSMDNELINEWTNYAKSIGLNIRIEDNSNGNKSKNYHITSNENKDNIFKQFLQKMNLIQNKHIPKEYLTSSSKNRKALLAGLIDTDGSYDGGIFDIIQKNEQLTDNIVFLARSLGLAAYKSKCEKGCTYKDESIVGDYYRICISGDLDIIPTKLERKQAKPREQIKSVLKTGFEIEYLDEDEYYGFSLDKDHLYLTSDFTIHHNTGKTVLVAKMSKLIAEEMNGVVLFNPNVNLLEMFIKTIRESEPNRKIVVLWEEFDSVINQNETELLCLLDGEIQAENIVYLATTNYISEIPARIKNRPSRFSLVQEIGLPTLEARKAYFNYKLKSKEDKDKYLLPLTDASEGFTIDQCKDLIVSVLLFELPISDAVLKLNETNEEHDCGYDDFQEENAKEIFKARKTEQASKYPPKNPFRR